jgi:two-component system CheB/CheR fusion protein
MRLERSSSANRLEIKDVVPLKRILLVDDYPDALEIWGLYLRSMGYEVRTAQDGLSAVESAHEFQPDVIVMDLELPEISGFEAARRLRSAADTRGIPMLAATGYSGQKHRDQAREAGFDAIIVKPCEPSTLVSEIERLLQVQREAHQPAPVKRLHHNR